MIGISLYKKAMKLHFMISCHRLLRLVFIGPSFLTNSYIPSVEYSSFQIGTIPTKILSIAGRITYTSRL